MASDVFEEFACSFYVRTETPGGYRYAAVPHLIENGRLSTRVPPSIGDLIWFGDTAYQLIAREWSFPSVGSMAWPRVGDLRYPTVAVSYLMVAAEGLFVDEVTASEDEESEE